MLKVLSRLTLNTYDDDKTRMSKILLPVLFFLAIITLVIIALAPFVHDKPAPLIACGAALLVLYSGLVLMIRHGFTKVAASILVAMLWLFFTSILILGGGIKSTGFINYFIVIVVAGLLFGRNSAIYMAALCICAAVSLLVAESNGYLIRSVLPTTGRSLIMTYSINYAMIAMLLYLARHNVEESLLQAKTSESRYHSLFENSPIPLWEEDFSQVRKYIDQLKASGVTDFDTYFNEYPEAVQHCAKLVRVLDVNKSSMNLLGAKKKIDVMKSVSRILGFEAADIFREELVTLIEGKTTFDAEAIQTTLTGEKIHTVANIAVAPGCEKDWSKVFVSSLDVTQRRRAEQVLRTLNEAALSVVEALTHDEIFEAMGNSLKKLGYSCAVFLLDSEGYKLRVRYVNYDSTLVAAALKTVNVNLETFEIPVDRVDIFTEIIRNRKTLLVEGIEPVKKMLFNMDRGLVARIVGVLNMPKSIFAPLITEDKVIGMLCVLGDNLTLDDRPAITAFAHQMASAQRKASLMENLEGSLQELKSTQEQLLQSQKMEAIGKLAGGVAHDFNNLLTAIIGYTDLLIRKQEGDNVSQTNLHEIKKAADRAAALTSQLLAFSRKQVLQLKVLNLNSVIESMTGMLKRLIGEDVEFRTKLQPDLDLVKADSGQFEQVLMNLSVNSRDAIPRGGSLTIETKNCSVSEEHVVFGKGVKSGAYVQLSFSDTGTGMDAETKKRIFEPFFTTKKHGAGTGLGLSTVYGIVKQSGGYIYVDSSPGEGSTFNILLPRMETEDQAKRKTRHSPVNLRGSENVLLVEDEEMVRDMVNNVLEGYGYRVIAASTADEAFKMCSDMQVTLQLMITDVVMPGTMSGHDLAERLSDQYPGIRVLYMSGYTENTIVHHGMLDPQVHFIQKPFRPASLLSKVREVLDTDL